MGGRVFRNYYKGHMNKTKGVSGSKRGRWVLLGWVAVVGSKCKLKLNNNKII